MKYNSLPSHQNTYVHNCKFNALNLFVQAKTNEGAQFHVHSHASPIKSLALIFSTILKISRGDIALMLQYSRRTCSILWWNRLSSNLRTTAEEVAKKNDMMTMSGGRRFASSLSVTYHEFAAQGEHIGRAAPQGSRPNIHFRIECQINFFMRRRL